jgi:hypothetical protein
MKKFRFAFLSTAAILLIAPSTLLASTNILWQAIGISEFMATNQNTIQDEDGDNSPWIEIFNPTTNDVILNGWALTDDTNNLKLWRFPNVTIPDAADANESDIRRIWKPIWAKTLCFQWLPMACLRRHINGTLTALI